MAAYAPPLRRAAAPPERTSPSASRYLPTSTAFPLQSKGFSATNHFWNVAAMAAEGPKMPPLSKMVPLVAMMALNKLDLEALGLRQHCGGAMRRGGVEGWWGSCTCPCHSCEGACRAVRADACAYGRARLRVCARARVPVRVCVCARARERVFVAGSLSLSAQGLDANRPHPVLARRARAAGTARPAEIAFFCVQMACLFVLNMIQTKIAERPEKAGEDKVKVPAEVVMGNEAKPAREVTVRDYDAEQFQQLRTQQLMGAVIMGGVYYKWRSLMPLVLQVLLTPINLYEHQLFQIYLLGRDVTRPFPKPNPFGMPEAPAAEAGAPQVDSANAAAPAAAIKEASGTTVELACQQADFGGVRNVTGRVCRAVPLAVDDELANASDLKGKIAVAVRGVVPFLDKAVRVQKVLFLRARARYLSL